MEEAGPFGLVLFGLTIWLVFRYFWLRVIAVAAGLGLWFMGAIGAPLYLALKSLQDGELFIAILQLAAGVLMGTFWYIGYDGARNWLKLNRLDRPWNATD